MRLIIKDINIDISSFNEAERKSEGDWETRLNVELSHDIDVDTKALSMEIEEKLDDGKLSVESGDQIYNFDGYKFDSLDRYVNDVTARVTISFVK